MVLENDHRRFYPDQLPSQSLLLSLETSQAEILYDKDNNKKNSSFFLNLRKTNIYFRWYAQNKKGNVCHLNMLQ